MGDKWWTVYVTTTGVIPVGFLTEEAEAQRFYDDVKGRMGAAIDIDMDLDPQPARIFEAAVPNGKIVFDSAKLTSVAIAWDWAPSGEPR